MDLRLEKVPFLGLFAIYVVKVVVAAGPTREYIDDIRFISNGSSGLMGCAIASEALSRGHEVVLVLGPTNVRAPDGVRVVDVVSADDMIDAVLEELKAGADVLVSAAALADYTPDEKIEGKIRSGGELTLRLKRTRKLIGEARKMFPKLKIVAFKAEYGGTENEMIDRGRSLLGVADLVVVNDVSEGVFGSSDNEVYIVGGNFVEHVGRCGKDVIAKRVLTKAGV